MDLWEWIWVITIQEQSIIEFLTNKLSLNKFIASKQNMESKKKVQQESLIPNIRKYRVDKINSLNGRTTIELILNLLLLELLIINLEIL